MADKHEETPQGRKSQDVPEGSTPEHHGAPEASRRRFTKAGLATPVIMSLASQPVWGTGRLCTASAFASATPSRPVDVSTCIGCSPGYWYKVRTYCWPNELDYQKSFYESFGYASNAYDSYAPIDSSYPTKSQVLHVLQQPLGQFFPSDADSSLSRFIRAALAAMLNAYHPGIPFWNDVDADDVRTLMEDLFPPNPNNKSIASNSVLDQRTVSLHKGWDDQREDCFLSAVPEKCDENNF